MCASNKLRYNARVLESAERKRRRYMRNGALPRLKPCTLLRPQLYSVQCTTRYQGTCMHAKSEWLNSRRQTARVAVGGFCDTGEGLPNAFTQRSALSSHTLQCIRTASPAPAAMQTEYRVSTCLNLDFFSYLHAVLLNICLLDGHAMPSNERTKRNTATAFHAARILACPPWWVRAMTGVRRHITKGRDPS